jgi:hypothetical protein
MLTGAVTRPSVCEQAYAERKRAKTFKPLDRRKLEPRIRDYIRDSVRNLIDKRAS